MRFEVSRIAIIAVLATAIIGVPGVASAFDETTSTIPPTWDETNCGGCHDPWPDAAIGSGPNSRIGVHGGYTTTTTKCSQCHSVHMAPAASSRLLPGATIKATWLHLP